MRSVHQSHRCTAGKASSNAPNNNRRENDSRRSHGVSTRDSQQQPRPPMAPRASQSNRRPRSSGAIPLPAYHIPQTPSELELSLSQDEAAARDVQMLYRLCAGIRSGQAPPTTPQPPPGETASVVPSVHSEWTIAGYDEDDHPHDDRSSPDVVLWPCAPPPDACFLQKSSSLSATTSFATNTTTLQQSCPSNNEDDDEGVFEMDL